MALSTVVKLLDRQGLVLIETNAQHWDAQAVRRELGDARWADFSQVPGFSDFVTDLDAAAAQKLYEYFRASYVKWIALYEGIANSYRSKGEHKLAEDHERVADDDRDQLSALTEIVRRAEAEGLWVRVLLEEWSSGY